MDSLSLLQSLKRFNLNDLEGVSDFVDLGASILVYFSADINFDLMFVTMSFLVLFLSSSLRLSFRVFLFNYYSLFESDDYWFKVLSLRNDRSGRAIATHWEAEYKALYRYNPRYPKELLRD